MRIPDESPGIKAVVQTLISAFDHVDIVALGEAHQRKPDSDLSLALVRHPDFPKKVRSIVVEFASTTEQATLDRCIRGENVSRAQLANAWKTTIPASNGGWDDPIYPEFFAAVREVNSRLPAYLRIRVFGGDPGLGDNRSREIAAVALLKEKVLQKHSKALVIYGAAHFYRAAPKDYFSNMGQDIGIVRMVEKEYPGRTFAVIPVGYRWAYPPSIFEPDYRKFDRALETHARPVLVSLQHLSFRDFSEQEFVGPWLNARGPGGPVSVFKRSKLTLGQMADACVYIDDSK